MINISLYYSNKASLRKNILYINTRVCTQGVGVLYFSGNSVKSIEQVSASLYPDSALATMPKYMFYLQHI